MVSVLWERKPTNSMMKRRTMKMLWGCMRRWEWGSVHGGVHWGMHFTTTNYITHVAQMERSPPRLVDSVKSKGTRRYRSILLAAPEPPRCVAMVLLPGEGTRNKGTCVCVGLKSGWWLASCSGVPVVVRTGKR